MMQKITPEYLETQIESEHYWHVPGTRMTVCVLIGKNTVEALGDSYCMLAEEYTEERGKMFARRRAFDKLIEYYTVELKAQRTKGT